MAATGFWYIGTDNAVHLQNLKNEDGDFINNATSVIGTLKDLKKNVIVGAESITFTFKPGSTTGEYDGVVPALDNLKEDTDYDLYVIILAGGRKFTGRIRLKAKFFAL